MPKVTEITDPYFSHDMNARSDEKILKMFFDFRKYAISETTETIKHLVPLAAYGIFWSIVEYMHRNTLRVEDVEILADDLRIDVATIKKVLNEYDLFKVVDGYYVSERINKNLNKVEEKSSKSSEAASRRWTLSNLKKVYNNVFETDPILSNKEANIFYDYSQSIPDFKDKLPDILYTLKYLKFENNPKFTPSINWLLKDNHLTTLLNGGWGKLKSWETHLEYINKKGLIKDEVEPIEKIFTSKVDALEYLAEQIPDPNSRFIIPNLKNIMNQFDITPKEIEDAKERVL